ncbi:MAG: hypothetical protein WCJ33_07200 [Pseudomonadota bacterium]
MVSSKTINTGEVQNKGVELAIRATPISTKKGFKWEVYGTYTKNTNEVVSLTEGVEQIVLGGTASMAIVAQVGKPYGAFYGTDLQTDPNGNVVVDPSSGLPLLTTELVYQGNYQPDFVASWGTGLSYKGITLNALFDTKQGGIFFSQTRNTMAFVGTSKETEKRDDYVWEGSVVKNLDGSYSPNTTPFHPYDYYTSTVPFADGVNIVDASFVKLRELSIGYKLPAKWLTKTPLGNVTVGLFGSNLFIWTPKENKYSDPEQNSSGSSNTQGFELNATPSQRNFGFDIRVTF